jgi:hypothetical protein
MCTSRRALCVLALAALAAADMRPQIRAVDPKDQEDKFCETNRLNDIKSVACVSWQLRKRHGYGYIGANAWRNPTRTQETSESRSPSENLSRGRTVTRNKYLTGRQLESSLRSASGKGNRSRPSWTSRFPDPEGRESATPFPCGLRVHTYLSWWHRHPRLALPS